MSGGPVALTSDTNATRYQKRWPLVHFVNLCRHLVVISQFIRQEPFKVTCTPCVCVCLCVSVCVSVCVVCMHIRCVCMCVYAYQVLCVCVYGCGVYAYQVFSKRDPYSKLFSYDTKMSSAFLLSFYRKFTVAFSENFMTRGITTDWMQKQIWNPTVLCLSQTLEDFKNVKQCNSFHYLFLFGKRNCFIKICDANILTTL